MSLNGVSFTNLIKIRPPQLVPRFLFLCRCVGKTTKKMEGASDGILNSFDCNLIFMI